VPVERLSALDASFLSAETSNAHMHVGWAATFAPPEDGEMPTFGEIRAHIAARLPADSRYRQRLAAVPFGVHQPAWVTDERFDIDRHLRRTAADDLQAIVDAVMSESLPRDRPLWQIWVADRLADGRLGLVGKMHHCMVDGLAAVQLSSALLDLDDERRPVPIGPVREAAGEEPDPFALLAGGVLDRIGEQARLAQASLRALGDPLAIPRATRRFVRTLANAALPVAPRSALNRPSSPQRHLARLTRPLDDLRAIGRRFDTTVNDVLLASVAGALHRFLPESEALKVMVPVNVADRDGALGNHISFIFVELPCEEPDPVVRLMRINRDTASSKLAGEPADADTVLQMLGFAPRRFQRAMTGVVSHPRLFNLTVSNIPGPRAPLYLRGCRLEAAWPVVPLAEGHAVSVGMTTVCDTACFGVYADRSALPEADALAGLIDRAIDELEAS
jgi:WS/DGAT/MGAT family acyltransferase